MEAFNKLVSICVCCVTVLINVYVKACQHVSMYMKACQHVILAPRLVELYYI